MPKRRNYFVIYKVRNSTVCEYRIGLVEYYFERAFCGEREIGIQLTKKIKN